MLVLLKVGLRRLELIIHLTYSLFVVIYGTSPSAASV